MFTLTDVIVDVVFTDGYFTMYSFRSKLLDEDDIMLENLILDLQFDSEKDFCNKIKPMINRYFNHLHSVDEITATITYKDESGELISSDFFQVGSNGMKATF